MYVRMRVFMHVCVCVVAWTGICLDTRCVCNKGWNGTTCSTCSAGFYGPTCASCPKSCNRGYCDDGISGSGKCVCPAGTSGSDCSTCDGDFAGPYCLACPPCSAVTPATCEWSPGANNTFCNCTSPNYDPVSNCTGCVNGNFGTDCGWVMLDVVLIACLAGAVAVGVVVILIWCIRMQTRQKYENRSMYSEPFHNIHSTPGVEEQRQELLRHDKNMFNVMVRSLERVCVICYCCC